VLTFALAAIAAIAPVAAAAAPDSLATLRREAPAARPGDLAWLAFAEREAGRQVARRGLGNPAATEALAIFGRHLLACGENLRADSVFAMVLESHRRARRPDSLALAAALGWRAESLRSTRRLALAESTATVALAILARAPRPDTASLIRLHRTLGDALAERGEPTRAREEMTRAIEWIEATAKPDSVQLATTLRNRARARILEGAIAEARHELDRASGIQERVLGPDHPELATTHYFATFVAEMDGDYLARRRHAERALQIRERAFGPRHPAVAAAYSALGSAVRNVSGGAAALPYYERAVAILRPRVNENPAELATALGNLGGNFLSMGEGDSCRAYLQESRRVRERAFGPGRGSSFWGELRLAQSWLASGRRDSAERVARALLASPARRNALEQTDAYLLLGVVDYQSGRYAAAESLFAAALVTRDSVVGSAAAPSLHARALRAAARLEIDQWDAAFEGGREVEIGSRELLATAGRALSEREALEVEAAVQAGLDLMVEVARRRRDLPESNRRQLMDAVIRVRLSVLEVQAEEARALPRGEAALAGPLHELETARAALAAELARAARREEMPGASLAAARARREAAERALAERSERFRAGRARASAGFDEIAAALPAGSALVSYLRREGPARFVRSAGQRPRADASPEYLALVLRAGTRSPAVVPLGSAARIEPAVAAWVSACATPPPAGELSRAAERRARALGLAVRALAWDPLANAIGGASRVFVVPDGVLAVANFLALPDGSQGYLVEGPSIVHRLDAERDLLPRPDGERAGRGLLAMGGPDFDWPDAATGLLALAETRAAGGAARDSAGNPRFPPLPHAAEEARDVAALWREAGLPPDDAAERTGPLASEPAFRELAPGRRVLHLATHGFSLDTTRASARAGDDGSGHPPGRDSLVAGLRAVGALTRTPRTPLLERGAIVPGLALAGANRSLAGAGDDGFLTGEEITSLDLSGVEWAVLSACETGLADPGAIEAVQGLHRAFRRAGLRTLIVSLWAVGDRDTREWMRDLYSARWLRHRDTAESVRDACRGALAARRRQGFDTHPFRWAAFVASGDFR